MSVHFVFWLTPLAPFVVHLGLIDSDVFDSYLWSSFHQIIPGQMIFHLLRFDEKTFSMIVQLFDTQHKTSTDPHNTPFDVQVLLQRNYSSGRLQTLCIKGFSEVELSTHLWIFCRDCTSRSNALFFLILFFLHYEVTERTEDIQEREGV